MNSRSENPRVHRSRWLEFGLPLLLLIFVLSTWGGYWYWIDSYFTGQKAPEERGLFGDMFGGANALFSALAFAGLIYAIVLQREDLKLQQQELADTRAVMIKQEQQMAAQAETLSLQQFESTFFQLVGLHHQIVDGIVQNDPPIPGVHGRAALRFMLDQLGRRYDEVARLDPAARVENLHDYLENAFGHNLGHYFRNLYHIAKFVHESGLPNRKRYMNFLRAQLSHPELVLLFVNSLDPDYVAWHEYINEYALFEPMPKWRLDGPMLRLYRTARPFGNNETLLALYGPERDAGAR